MERDWSEWLTVRDPSSSEVFFSCAHCGNGDYGWQRTDNGFSTHYKNFEELFIAVSWVLREHIENAWVVGYFRPEFMAWWNENKED
jgi:hypothetical protein